MDRLVYFILIIIIGSSLCNAFGATALNGANVSTGSSFQFYSIPYCIDVVKVKVTPKATCYSLPGCELQPAGLWHCKCSRPTNLIFLPGEGCQGLYDIVIQFQVDKISNRIQNFNNILVADPSSNQFKGPIEVKPENFIRIGVQLLVLAVILFSFAFWLIRKLYINPPEDVIDERYSWDRQKRI